MLTCAYGHATTRVYLVLSEFTQIRNPTHSAGLNSDSIHHYFKPLWIHTADDFLSGQVLHISHSFQYRNVTPHQCTPEHKDDRKANLA